MLQGPLGRKCGDADDVRHEQRHALQIDDEYLARQGRNRKEQRSGEKYLNHDDRKKRLQIPAQMIRADAGVIRPRREACQEYVPISRPLKTNTVMTNEPAQRPPEVREFGDRLGEENLVCIALKIAQDRRAENRRNDDQTEQAGRLRSLNVMP